MYTLFYIFMYSHVVPYLGWFLYHVLITHSYYSPSRSCTFGVGPIPRTSHTLCTIPMLVFFLHESHIWGRSYTMD